MLQTVDLPVPVPCGDLMGIKLNNDKIPTRPIRTPATSVFLSGEIDVISRVDFFVLFRRAEDCRAAGFLVLVADLREMDFVLCPVLRVERVFVEVLATCPLRAC